MTRGFLPGFLWGSSTNAQQYEGGWNEGGRGPSIADVRKINGMPDFSEFKTASDHYHHYKEDIALLGEMGFSIYRFSISWSRILPSGNDPEPNEEGLRFYEAVLDELEKYNIQPVVTLYAYDLPLHLLEEYGGWKSRRCIEDYLRYAGIVFQRYKGRVKFWVAFNEPNCVIRDAEYMTGLKDLTLQETYQVDHHFTLAYARVTRLLHEIDPAARIGPNVALNAFYPATCAPGDVRATWERSYEFMYTPMDIYLRKEYPTYHLKRLQAKDALPIFEEGDLKTIARAEPDFLSVTYYSSKVVKAGNGTEKNIEDKNQELNPFLLATEWGWNIDPEGFYLTLMDTYQRYRIPILILENGLGHRDFLEDGDVVQDDYRIRYLRDHIVKLREAIEDGVEVIGYLTWSAIDLFSTRDGYAKRYGFVYVNRTEQATLDLRRIRKKSFAWYKKVIATNAEDLE